MFIRSKTSIKRGEELLIAYVEFNESYEIRSRKLMNHYGFICDCRLCAADRAESPEILARFEEIDKLMDKMKNEYEIAQKFTRKDRVILENLLNEVVAYRPDKSINIVALRIRDALSVAAPPKKALKILEENFDACMAMMHVRGAYGVAKAATDLSMKIGESHYKKWSSEVKKLTTILWGDECLEKDN